MRQVALIDVQVLENRSTVFINGLEFVNKCVLMYKVARDNIDIKVNASITRVENKSVTYILDGQEVVKECDMVIVSTGQKPYVPNLITELKKSNIDVITIGDAFSIGKIVDAVSEGFHQAYNL